MPPIPDSAVFQERLAALPVATYQAGETVFAAGSRTGRLLILRKGAVVIVKEDVEIAKVAEPGAVFGELSVLLDQPHTAHVRALETSQFLVADATTFLAQDGANQVFIQLKSQLEGGPPRSVVAKTVEKLEGLLGVSDASLVHDDRDW